MDSEAHKKPPSSWSAALDNGGEHGGDDHGGDHGGDDHGGDHGGDDHGGDHGGDDHDVEHGPGRNPYDVDHGPGRNPGERPRTWPQVCNPGSQTMKAAWEAVP
jgi:hypothetical protein